VSSSLTRTEKEHVINQLERVVLPLGRRARSAVWPALARRYRANPRAASSLTLKIIGIADVSYRPDFTTLAHAVDQTANMRGAIIECGVFRGSTLLGMAHRLAVHGVADATLIGCDSFQGFPTPSQEDALHDGHFHERTQEGVFKETSCETLTEKIAALGYSQNIRLLKGFFCDTLPLLSKTKFRLAHLDCDLYQSYLTSLEFLYPRLLPGGYIVFDEYDFSESVYPGAKRAIDEFFRDKPETLQRFHELSDSRCFIVKR
jgi:hypothetical protein